LAGGTLGTEVVLILLSLALKITAISTELNPFSISCRVVGSADLRAIFTGTQISQQGCCERGRYFVPGLGQEDGGNRDSEQVPGLNGNEVNNQHQKGGDHFYKP
jgi:hypothetical protein